MKKIIFLVYVVSCYTFANAQSPPITRIEPPFWWAGMKHQELQLLVQGQNIGNATVVIHYPGVEVVKVNKADNKNFLFIDLALHEDVKPGTFSIEFTGADKKRKIYRYELKERNLENSHQGLNTSDVIYLITPDRFANGDPANDDSKTLTEKKNRPFHGGRHGGDIKGMIDKIGYLNDLGVTSVWSMPMLENNMPEYSYHGYACTDYYQVDARFGTNDLYKQFGDELHKKNMKLVMDMVFNHCGVQHWWMKDMPFHDWVHYYPNMIETNHAMASLSDPHGAQSDRDQMEKGWFVPSMPDLNHDNPYLANYLIQNSVWWIEYAGLNGIRQDTYPYNKKDFMVRWAQYVHAEYPDFFLVGESWVDNEAQESYWSDKGNKAGTGYNSGTNMTDFPLCFALQKAFKKDGSLQELYRVISKDFLYHNSSANMIFGDNHDMDRFFYSISEDLNRFKSAMTFLLTTRGIPQLYYGTELLMKGHGQHGDIREDFPGGWSSDNRNAFLHEGRTQQENEAFTHVQKLLQWRQKSDAIRNGELKHFVPKDNIYVYNRKSPNESVVVIINTNAQPKKIDMTCYQEILNGYGGAIDILHNKKITNLKEIDIEANSSLVLELTPPFKAEK